MTGRSEAKDTRAILDALRMPFAPHLVAHFKSEHNAVSLSDLAGFTAGLSSPEGVATAHICRGFSCKNSTTDVTMLLKQLARP